MQNAQQHEATACFAEQRGNHANYASHKTVQVIPPMMHVTNLTSMVTTLNSGLIHNAPCGGGYPSKREYDTMLQQATCLATETQQ